MKYTNKEQGFSHLLLFLAVPALLTISFAGWRVYNSTQKQNQLNSSRSDTAAEISTEALGEIMSIESMKKLATESTEETVTNLELENEDGALVYKITLSNGKQIAFDAKTGAKINLIDSDIGHDDGAIPAGFVPTVSMAKAAEIALKQFPGGKIIKIALESEEGIVVLSVRFSDKSRVDVNAMNGAVVRTKAPSKHNDKTQEHKDDASERPSDHQSDSSSSSSDVSHDDSAEDEDSNNSGSGSSGSH